jgi:hypothetical protein
MNNIERRLRKLEAKRNPPQQMTVDGLALVTHGLPAGRKLAPGERVVIDWYDHSECQLSGRERITTDPADKGRHCKRDGYLLDVMQELNRLCMHGN